MPQFTWARRGGYEVSSKGDARFSALYARLSDGRSIEQHYQCDQKGYDPGGMNWRLGKGKQPLNPNINLWESYLSLWRDWAMQNLPLMRELYVAAKNKDYVLSDCHASTDINQAHALATILNELVATGKAA